MLEYETANPGQDFDEKEDAAADPNKDVRDVQRPTPMAAPAPNGGGGGGGHSRDPSGEHSRRQSRGQSGDYNRGHSSGGGGQRYSQGPNAEAGKAGNQRGAGRDLRDRRY